MASNLNKAFMRAYAKDRGHEVPEAQQAASEQVAASSAQPIPARHAAQQVDHRSHLTLHANPQAAARPLPPAPKVISGRPAQSTPARTAPALGLGTTAAAPKQVAAQTVAEAAKVWQRLDAAQAPPTPHVVTPPARGVTTSVGAGSQAGPKQMRAAAAAPVAPQARTAPVHQPQPVDLPLLAEDFTAASSASSGDPQAAESRRRTVADFLYSAGKVSASSSRAAVTATSQAMAEAPLSAPTFGRPAHSGIAPSAARSQAVASQAVASHAVPSQAVASQAVVVPTQSPVRPSEGAPFPAPAQPLPKQRTGQILRVDVPRGVRQSENISAVPAAVPTSPAAVSTAAVSPAAKSPAREQRMAATPEQHLEQPYETPIEMPVAAQRFAKPPVARTLPETAPPQPQAIDPPAARYAIEQRRIDRAHELNAAEQQLRRYKHKIFNPVWEVDSLQWPGVCDKLMFHRAESMAQVAAHLKAACEDGLSVLGVTSAGNGEGRTTVACCLARLAAAHGLNVALVDLDLDHPTLCLQTNLEIDHDWRDHLGGVVKLEESAVHSIDDQLTLLPLNPRGDRAGLLASDTRIADILFELSESFELLIVDASRMHSSGNVISGLAHTQVFDASIVVVDRRNSDQQRIEDAVRAVQQTGIESIGIVDNFSM